MTKKEEVLEEAIPQAERERPGEAAPDVWVLLVQLWAAKTNSEAVAKRLRSELERQGINSVDEIASAPMGRLLVAARAAIQADAQALQAAALKLGGQK